MTDAINPAQMHVRLVRFLPRDLARTLHPKAVDTLLDAAWENGWRDAEWLATYALEGTDHPSVRDAAAVFTARLKDICSQPCPSDSTPEPPPLAEVMATMHAGHEPASDPKRWATRIREGLRR